MSVLEQVQLAINECKDEIERQLSLLHNYRLLLENTNTFIVDTIGGSSNSAYEDILATLTDTSEKIGTAISNLSTASQQLANIQL